MRIFVVILGLAVVLLQYRLWVSEQGMHELVRLQIAIDTQTQANREQRDRNRQLAAEVDNLKVGLTAIEERARSELGMVGKSETFFQVVKSRPATTPMPVPTMAPVSQPLTARAQ
ncbi:MAG: cell division protein FtsB [Steroidobacterales bacterium]